MCRVWLTNETELRNKLSIALVDIVNRWPGISPAAAVEQSLWECQCSGRNSAERLCYEAMWQLLSDGNRIRFDIDRALKPVETDNQADGIK